MVSSEDKMEKKIKKRLFHDPMAVTWMEKYSDKMDKIWAKIPSIVGSTIATLAVFLLGATLRGYNTVGNSNEGNVSLPFDLSDLSLESFKLQNLLYFWIGASSVAYGMYFTIGGFLHPQKWLSPDLERHEIIVGSVSLLFTNTFTATIACYISNGGWSTVYYEFAEYTWTWWFLQWIVIFVYQDYVTYLLHRLYHTPFLYKHFHKLHHKYKQPTAFSVTAIHPVEIMHIQVTLLLPIFVFPVHFVPFYVIALYTYYHGIIDHSGVNFKAYWWQPWQPDAIFHDNHHQYFHVNFGFNCFIWDKLHGTYRRKDRIYTEDIFYGQGKALTEATETELMNDLKERESENPLAYRNNEMEFKLTEDDLKKRR
ncbi:hypothetical protein C0J52_24977 [Blattella germanica]|nr:hypothetical protein C0J52_24977 [Blattella germanica]